MAVVPIYYNVDITAIFFAIFFYDFFKNLLDFGNDKIYNQYTAFAESLIQKSEKLKNNFKSC